MGCAMSNPSYVPPPSLGGGGFLGLLGLSGSSGSYGLISGGCISVRFAPMVNFISPAMFSTSLFIMALVSFKPSTTPAPTLNPTWAFITVDGE